jgi:hypothetical protein
MPVSAIDTTAGSATANAYVTIAVADQYDLDRVAVGTTWSAATTPAKTSAILWATMLMDRLWTWDGYPTDAIQALQWPRGAILKPNGWEYVDIHVIPIELQRATAEYARQLMVSDRTADSDVETQGIASIKAGPVAINFKESVYAKQVPDIVINLIPPGWGYVSGRRQGVRDLLRA